MLLGMVVFAVPLASLGLRAAPRAGPAAAVAEVAAEPPARAARLVAALGRSRIASRSRKLRRGLR